MGAGQARCKNDAKPAPHLADAVSSDLASLSRSYKRLGQDKLSMILECPDVRM
jgi:hypothetical protein